LRTLMWADGKSSTQNPASCILLRRAEISSSPFPGNGQGIRLRLRLRSNKSSIEYRESGGWADPSAPLPLFSSAPLRPIGRVGESSIQHPASSIQYLFKRTRISQIAEALITLARGETRRPARASGRDNRSRGLRTAPTG
jgi:hypothetical protein